MKRSVHGEINEVRERGVHRIKSPGRTLNIFPNFSSDWTEMSLFFVSDFYDPSIFKHPNDDMGRGD